MWGPLKNDKTNLFPCKRQRFTFVQRKSCVFTLPPRLRFDPRLYPQEVAFAPECQGVDARNVGNRHWWIPPGHRRAGVVAGNDKVACCVMHEDVHHARRLAWRFRGRNRPTGACCVVHEDVHHARRLAWLFRGRNRPTQTRQSPGRGRRAAGPCARRGRSETPRTSSRAARSQGCDLSAVRRF